MSSTTFTAAQTIFKRIVVHNKIMDEGTAEKLLAQQPDPEKIIRYLVQQKKLKTELGQQLLSLYQKQLEKQAERPAASEPAPVAAKAPAASPSEDDFFASLLSDTMSSDDRPTDDDDSAAEPLDEKPAAAVPLASASPPAAPRAAQSPPPIAADIVVPSLAARDDLPLLELDTDDDETPPIAPAVQPKTPAPPAPKPAGHGHAAAPAATTPTAASIAAVARSNAAPNRASLSPLIVRLLQAARAANASDLHIKSNEIPLLRVAGGLREVEGEQPLKAEDAEAGLLTLLSDAQRERFLSTNDLDFCFDGGAELGRFRTNFLRQFRGMDGIFRLISAQVPSFEELKMPPAVKKFTEYKQGIVLITGPKGCGKTTTLAAMVDLINSTRAEHIITIEDPIEFVHPCKMGHVNQREVGSHTKEFANALRAALREAPDVIMVGEMRDLETTSLAITAAETGHLVFATLHTPDAIRTIDRVLDVFPPKEQGQIRSMISESMRGIISQLLLPSVDGKSQELAVEILVNTTAIGNLIREEKTYQLRGIMQTGKRLGMQLMDDSLIDLAKAGRIAKDEAAAVCSEQVRVRKELGLSND